MTDTTELRAAFEKWAEKEMPWVLDPQDEQTDSERLCTVTARIAFERGHAAGHASATQQHEGEVMHMALCESESVVLREGQLYTFRKTGDCEKCAALSAASLNAYGEPPPEQPAVDAALSVAGEPKP